MRAVVTRVKSASVTIDGRVNGEIGQGLLVLLGVWALFLLFTFRAPDLAVFVDPLTGMRGIG